VLGHGAGSCHRFWPPGGSGRTDGEGSSVISIVLVVFVVLAMVLLKTRMVMDLHTMAITILQVPFTSTQIQACNQMASWRMV